MDKFIIIAKKYLVYLTGLIFFVLFCTTVTAVYKYKTLLKKYALIQEGIKVNKITAGPVTTVTKTVRYIDLTDKEKEKIAVKFNQEIEWLNFVIKQLKDKYISDGIEIKFQETKLSESRMAESNQILINGVLLENLIPGAKSGENYCNSCSDLIDDPKGCHCRTVNQGEAIYEDIPIDLIKQAIKNYLKKRS